MAPLHSKWHYVDAVAHTVYSKRSCGERVTNRHSEAGPIVDHFVAGIAPVDRDEVHALLGRCSGLLQKAVSTLTQQQVCLQGKYM
jgi:hypothetical protein